MRTYIHSIAKLLFLPGLILTGSLFAQAQSPQLNLKKWANISLNVKSKQKEPEKTYFNAGLVSNNQNICGWGMNIISSISLQNTSGFQAAGIFNVTGLNVKGIQIAGIANATGRTSKGIILSGLMNANGQDLDGLIFSGVGNVASRNQNGLVIGGLINISGKNSSGMIIGGLGNIARNQKGIIVGGLINVVSDTLKGIQLTSLMNVAGKENKGVQVAALSNINVSNKGVQLATLNYATNNTGIQFGIGNINNTSKKGAQIGLLNISGDSAAHQIGLLNINPATRAQLRISSGNLNKLNVSVRIKGRHTYTEWGGGIYYSDWDAFSPSAFYRAGIYQLLGKNKKWTLSGDMGFYHIETSENEEKGRPAHLYALQPRIGVEYSITKKFGLFAAGGYSWTRAYKRHSSPFEHKATFEAGIVLF